jgi:hypothetical protein
MTPEQKAEALEFLNTLIKWHEIEGAFLKIRKEKEDAQFHLDTANFLRALADEASARDAELAEARAEVARLREALRSFVYETTHLSPLEDDGSHWCRISAETLSKGRAALSQGDEVPS